MKELIIGALTLFAAVLAALLKGSCSKVTKLKEENKDREVELQLIKSQMESVYECKKDLGLIDEKRESTKPEVKEAPSTGDVNARLERLNSLHKH